MSSTDSSAQEVLSAVSTCVPRNLEFLYLDQEAVLAADVLDMHRAMDVLAEAHAMFAKGETRQPHKIVLRNEETAESEEQGRFNGLCASLGVPPSSMGIKWNGSFPSNREFGLPRASALIILNSVQTGFPIALMDGTLVSAMRTGAVTGLGVRYLAPRKTRKVGMIGSGVQSRTQILALHTELPGLEEISLYGRQRSRAEAVVEDCRQRWGAPVRVARTIDEALKDADVALTITTAHEPLMFARQIKQGALTIQLAGHECEFAVIQQCSKIVADDWEGVEHRGIMTPAIMYQLGLLSREDIHANLGELILARKAGRENEEERIHFCHMGMGIDDISLAWAVYQTACRRNLGINLPLWREPLWF